MGSKAADGLAEEGNVIEAVGVETRDGYRIWASVLGRRVR